MAPIEYRTTDAKDLELIRPLWEKLNEHHRHVATMFRSYYERTTFNDRKANFEKIAAAGSLRLDLAFDPEVGRYVGYCISSLSQEKTGQIESIFVERVYRSLGIGSALVARALAWLDANGSVRNRVFVATGNERAWDFYRKVRFYPRMTVLEEKRGSGK